MTKIDLEGSDPTAGLFALVITVVDILTEALEREAVRRMERDQLSDAEIERVGAQLQAIEEELDSLIEEQGLEEDVERLRHDLDSLVTDAIRQARIDEAATPESREVTVDEGHETR